MRRHSIRHARGLRRVSDELTEALAESGNPMSSAQAVMAAQRCLYCYAAACEQACPAHIEIASFVRRIANGDDRGAAQTILASNYLGASCARVCPADELCEGACVLSSQDKPIQIAGLQRYAMDSEFASGRPLVTAGPPTGRKVLVVGSGPAGLSAAAQLRQRGHQVEIWEARELAGGLSTYGILPMREPIEVAQREVNELIRAGVTVHTERPVTSEAQLNELRQSFDAILLATGLGGTGMLGIEHEQGAIDALDYIRCAKLDPISLPRPDKVAVIGAGNTAIDAATVAQRLGAQVTIVYRRGAKEMPAYETERLAAIQEGIEFAYLTLPIGIRMSRGHVTGLDCVQMQLGEPGPDGRAGVTPIPDSQFTIPVDAVIKANGQQGYRPGAWLGVRTGGGFINADPGLGTSLAGVWAAGDAVRTTGEASTVMAVQDGKLAAESICQYLELNERTPPTADAADESRQHMAVQGGIHHG